MGGIDSTNGASRGGSGSTQLGGEAAPCASATPAGSFTSPEEFNRCLARSDAEFEAFQEMDRAVLQSPSSMKAGTAQTLQEDLQCCGRLMRLSEVPAGFTGF